VKKNERNHADRKDRARERERERERERVGEERGGSILEVPRARYGAPK